MSTAVPARATDTSILKRARDLLLPSGVIASLLVVLVPLPPGLLDVLLAGNIALAVIVLLTTIYVRTPLEFSIFPTLLLATTLARLVLNIATTRLILADGDSQGLLAAGHVVRAFGEFVAGNDLIVGIVIFCIIIVIQFVVITKGATRISEVAARFALDGMPGRQLAIDADLNAGTIDQAEAQRRRTDLNRHADFFAAMDGASKFVRGDAVAGMLITAINIVGGLAIGVLQSGMSIGEASSIFTRLTIGDGLVSQVPAFLISLAAGLLVTRSSYETDLPREFVGQLFARPQALVLAGAFLGMLVFTSLPAIPLVLISGGCMSVALVKSWRARTEAPATTARESLAGSREERIEDYLATDAMAIEVGVGLVRLADPKRGGDLLARIQQVRREIAAELGIVIPKVRIRDNLQLELNQYCIKLAGNTIATSAIEPELLLAVTGQTPADTLPGHASTEPNSDRPAKGGQPHEQVHAQPTGVRPMSPAAVMIEHLAAVVREHAEEILSRDAAKHLLEELRKSQPAVIDDLIPGEMKLSEVHRVLQMLLREQVPIRQLGLILEALADEVPQTRDVAELAEQVRRRLARTISHRYRDQRGQLHVVRLAEDWEEQLAASLGETQGESALVSVGEIDRLLDQLRPLVDRLVRRNLAPIVLVSPRIRGKLQQLAASRSIRLVVLSTAEVTRDTTVITAGLLAKG